MTSPVKSSSAAFAGPTIAGRRSKPPTSQISPRRMNSSANFARSEAMRMSAYSASSMPQPTAAPLTAAITGTVALQHCHRRRASAARGPSRRRPVFLLAGHHLLDVLAGTERRVGAGHDDAAHLAVGTAVAERRLELRHRRAG